MMQPWGSVEKRGLAITQRQEQSPHEVASTLTITVRLRRHGIPTWWCMNVLPFHKLPCHLEKERRKVSVNNH
jgi:hypothetical protein